jgi:hypothetical protein
VKFEPRDEVDTWAERSMPLWTTILGSWERVELVWVNVRLVGTLV